LNNTKVVLRSSILMQDNTRVKKYKTNNGLQNITLKTKG
jgi:hypothetical protein